MFNPFDAAVDRQFAKKKGKDKPEGEAPPKDDAPAGDEPSFDELMELATPEERKVLEALKAKCEEAEAPKE
jgi:hypothetical protein